MIKKLLKLANHLDAKGLRREASYLDSILRKMAEETEEAFGAMQLLEKNIEEDPELHHILHSQVTYYKLNQGPNNESHIILALHKNHYYFFNQETKSWAEGCNVGDVESGSRESMICFEIKMAQAQDKLEHLSGGPPEEKYKFTPPQAAGPKPPQQADKNPAASSNISGEGQSLDLTPPMKGMISEQ
jgi:hypothetical protein